MTPERKQYLAEHGWATGSTQEFLGLTDEESALIDLKLSLGRSVRSRRAAQGLTQVQLAKLLNSSQSRVARIEAGDASVSLDLLIRSLLVMGTTRKDVARAIGT